MFASVFSIIPSVPYFDTVKQRFKVYSKLVLHHDLINMGWLIVLNKKLNPLHLQESNKQKK